MNEYPAINNLKLALRIVAFLILIGAIICLLIGLSSLTDEPKTALPLIISSIAAGIFFPLIFLGIAELLTLLVHIEQNTRKADPETVTIEASEWKNKTNKDWIEWANQNPGRSINDYYSEVISKTSV